MPSAMIRPSCHRWTGRRARECAIEHWSFLLWPNLLPQPRTQYEVVKYGMCMTMSMSIEDVMRLIVSLSVLCLRVRFTCLEIESSELRPYTTSVYW